MPEAQKLGARGYVPVDRPNVLRSNNGSMPWPGELPDRWHRRRLGQIQRIPKWSEADHDP